MLQDFNIPILKRRWCETNFLDDDSTITLSVSKGDILVVRFFRPNDHSMSYTYIEKVITPNGENTIMSECALSTEFIVQNTLNKLLFIVVTQQYERDKKIESLLL